MINSKWYLLMTAFILLSSCDDQQLTDTSSVTIEHFIGEYSIESTHISGIQTQYDSVGNIVFQGYDTTIISDDVFSIVQLNDVDTLLTNLINNFNHLTSEVQAVVSSDTVNLVHEFSVPQTKHNFVRGSIWLEADSIFLNYIWDKSDIWSAEALPVRGMVIGKGVRIQ